MLPFRSCPTVHFNERPLCSCLFFSPMSQRILLIGADAPLRASRKHLLERAGYDVAIATDHTALGRMSENDFDMVVLGPSLPDSNLGQLEDRIHKAHPRAFIVKIQEMSAHRGKSPNAFVESGMPAELLEAIATLFNLGHERIARVIPPRQTGATP